MLLLLAYLAYSQQISDPLGFSGSTFLHNRWNNNECLLGDCIRHPRSDTLLTFTVANVRHRTAGFLSSLASVNDKFDLLAIDEHSTDDTGDDLHAFGVHTLYVKESIGVTALWNEAWQYFMQRSEQYDKLIYSNNDVLVPNGVVDKLKAALDNGCDLVTPMSTVRGKGHVGHIEGLEVWEGQSNTWTIQASTNWYQNTIFKQNNRWSMICKEMQLRLPSTLEISELYSTSWTSSTAMRPWKKCYGQSARSLMAFSLHCRPA